jgi:hypothetical protein
MEVDCIRHLHGELMVCSYLPRIDDLLLLEADLENMGAAKGEILPLASQPR